MALLWREHPVLKPPTPEEMAVMEPGDLVRLHKLYHDAIENAERDPYRYGMRLPSWERADAVLDAKNETVILGGNRSSKTFYAANAVVKAALTNPLSTIWCFAQTNEVSISVQQAAIYNALPVEMRGPDGCTGYTRKGGFPRNAAGKCSIFFPNETEVVFKAYSQFLNNDTILEGAELGCKQPQWVNIGSWCDEYLVGPELLETLRFRTMDRAAKILVTFTPISGFTEVVRDYIAGARTTQWGVAELLDNEKVPLVQESKNRHATIVYFHTKENPFAGYKQLTETLAGRPREEVLTRAYGVAVKSMAGSFPSFSRDVNVVKHDDLPWIKNKDDKSFTRYLILDPAGRKKWFMAWIAVDAAETWWVYREWPDVSIGDWAEWKNGKWVAGEGAKPDGQVEGVNQYVDLILRAERENGETIFERLIDPRLGAAKYQSQTGVSSIIEDLADAGLIFNPAPGIEIEDGIQALKNKMSYDHKRPIDGTNRPRFYISDRCENIIRAIQEYTGEDGKDEAFKDCIDVIRYAAVAEIRYINPKWLQQTTGNRGAY